MKRHLLFLLLLISSISVANAPQPNTTQNNMVLCPTVSQLQKDGQQHWWATKAVHDESSNNPNVMIRYKWYSTSPSLAKSIDRFVGAQYHGSSEGHIICYYIPKVAFHTQAFPIFIYFESLSLRPTGAGWKQDPKNSGELNCPANNGPSGCPYLVYLPDSIKDPYESLRELG